MTVMSRRQGLITVQSVEYKTMKKSQKMATLIALLVATGINLPPTAKAHQKHGHGNHHAHKKQKAYDKGYRNGYKKAYRNNYHPHQPVYYQTIQRPIVVAPPTWGAPRHVIAKPYHYRPRPTRVYLGFGFYL